MLWFRVRSNFGRAWSTFFGNGGFPGPAPNGITCGGGPIVSSLPDPMRQVESAAHGPEAPGAVTAQVEPTRELPVVAEPGSRMTGMYQRDAVPAALARTGAQGGSLGLCDTCVRGGMLAPGA